MDNVQIQAIAQKRREAFSRLAPKISEHNSRASEIWRTRKGEISTIRAANEIKSNIGIIPGFFPTPRDLALRMIGLADIRAGMTVLEPEAGAGAIAEVIREETGIEPVCIEWNYSLYQALVSKGFNALHMDFLEYGNRASESLTFDRVVMNPPFENAQDIDHVYHAYSLLNPGGSIVSIMSAGTTYRVDKKTLAFRNWVDECGGYLEMLPDGSFSESRTNVRSCFAVIDKTP